MLPNTTTSLVFTPVVYRIQDKWDLLTVDGLPPTQSFYTFMPLEEYHSLQERPVEVWQAMRAEQWQTYSLEELNLTLRDFTVTASVFLIAGPAYAKLYVELANALQSFSPHNNSTSHRAAFRWVARASAQH